jgi:hypothetical protein
MPRVFEKAGVAIWVYSNDHVPPHVHARYGEDEELIIIESCLTYAGELPRNKRRIAVEFINEKRAARLELFYSLNPTLRR